MRAYEDVTRQTAFKPMHKRKKDEVREHLNANVLTNLSSGALLWLIREVFIHSFAKLTAIATDHRQSLRLIHQTHQFAPA